MTIAFTYMGTKRQLAGQVADIVSRAPPGPLLDAFAGMSAVGTAVAPDRPVWCNDAQYFAYSVARAYFTATRPPRLSARAIGKCQELFEENRAVLDRAFRALLAQERNAYNSHDVTRIRDISNKLITRGQTRKAEQERAAYSLGTRTTPYCLFASTYAGGYVGLDQAIQIDSIRFAIDELKKQKLIDVNTYQWTLLALCRALEKVSNSTGHYAQYLAIKEKTKQRFLAQRRKSIWREWQRALDIMHPLGTKSWRSSNKVFQGDAISLLKKLSNQKKQPSVIYCDPPYTSDHYSRYYHLVETLLLYDYPQVKSKGQYRTDRFFSPFSISTQVLGAFAELIFQASRLGSTFVLSYPDRALLSDPRRTLIELLRANFSKVEIAAELSHEHSTLGASNGIESSPVTELIFFAQS